MSSRWPRLDPNVSAVVSVTTASAAATTVVRTGHRGATATAVERLADAEGERERSQVAAEQPGGERRAGRTGAAGARPCAGRVQRHVVQRADEEHAEEHRRACRRR